MELGKIAELREYFTQKRAELKPKVDSGERFGLLNNASGLIYCCYALQELARSTKSVTEFQKYEAEVKKYEKLAEDVGKKVEGGWLW